MYILKTSEKTYGGFSNIEQIGNDYICDKTIYKASVIGEAVIEEVSNDWVNPIIIEQQKKSYNANQKQLRLKAYENECDPLFFKAQRNEITQQEWLDKVEQIKLRYPYQA
jgi:hypothetical protein